MNARTPIPHSDVTSLSKEAPPDVILPRPPGVVRRFFAEHPRGIDLTIVICYLFGVAIGVTLDILSTQISFLEDGTVSASDGAVVPEYLQWPWLVLAIVRVVAVAGALWGRRRYPLAGLIVVVVASIGHHGIQSFATSIALLFLLFAVPVFRSAAAGWVGYAIAVVGSILAELIAPTLNINTGPAGTLFADTGGNSPRELAPVLVMIALWYLVIVVIGINLGNRRRYLQAIIDRAHQLARERDQRAQLAVAQERSRIAREMHDIVAHSVSVMIALSEGAARTVSVAPEASVDAMTRSAETGRTALAEMRRLLGALNDPAERAELAPQPTVADLPALIDGFREAGLDASCVCDGPTAHLTGSMSQELAVYRVVQEGLTNVLRYAGVGATVRVTVTRDSVRTEVEVRDDGAAAGAVHPLSGVGSGRGLTGLAERVRVFGGDFAAGPVQPSTAGGRAGWRLWASIPTGEGTS